MTTQIQAEESPRNESKSADRCIQVCLPPLSSDQLERTLATIASAFDSRIIVSTPDAVRPEQSTDQLKVYSTPSSTPSQASLVPAAADYVNAWTAARGNDPAAILVLGPDCGTVSPGTLQRLAQSVLQGNDLVVPRYPMGASGGLINAGIVYPFTRSLFSDALRYPLPIDVALSTRMAERLATTGQHLTASNKSAAFIWPVAEAAFNRFRTCDVEGDARTLPLPSGDERTRVFETFISSLFSDAESKASFWQRAQLTGRSHPRDLARKIRPEDRFRGKIDPAALIAGFRAAQEQFSGVWSLVLPPNSLLSLKKLGRASGSFQLPENLWARTVFDFFLAFRLKLADRSTLFAAFFPIYQAWMASHILKADGDAAKAEEHIEQIARAFENDKPYLIARWRWPDRFNP